MPTKRSRQPAKPASAPPDYRAWKAHAAAMLERQGISTGVVRERDWRQLFIKGATPEQAVEQVQVHYHNARPTLERTRSKKKP